MPIFEDSRYSTARALDVDADRSGVNRSVLFLYTRRKLSPNTPIEQVYTTQFGDRFDTLAFKFGEDSRLWWVIAELNNFIKFPLFLDTGIRLKIPPLEVFKEIAGTG